MKKKSFKILALFCSVLLLASACHIGLTSLAEPATQPATPSSSYLFDFTSQDTTLLSKFTTDSNGTLVGNVSNNGIVTYETDTVPAMHIDARTSAPASCTEDFKAATQVAVKPNTVYTVLVRMRTRAEDKPIYFQVLDGTNKLLELSNSKIDKFFYSGTFTTGASVENVSLQFYMPKSASSRAYVHQLAVFEATESIVNGNFENGQNNWSRHSANSAQIVDATVSGNEGLVHGGNYALKLGTTEATSQNNDHSIMLHLPKNTDYVFTGWVKTGTKAASIRFRSIINNSTKSVGGSNQVCLGTATGDNARVAVPAETDWTQFTYEFNTGDNELVWMVISVDTGDSAYFDDFKLVRKQASQTALDDAYSYSYNFNFADKSLYNPPAAEGEKEYAKVFANTDGTGTDTNNGEVYYAADGTLGAVKFDAYNKGYEMKSSETLQVKPYTDYTVYIRMRSQNNGITFKVLNATTDAEMIAPIVSSNSDKFYRTATFNTGAATEIKAQFIVNNSRGFVYHLSIKENLDYLRNGDFENGTLQDYSQEYALGGSVADKATDAQGVHSGNHSLKMTGYSEYTNLLQVKPNTDYIVYGWVKTTGASAYMRVRSLTSDTKALGSGTVKILDNTLASSDEWQRVYGEINTGDNTNLLLYLSVDANGTAYFDDLVLQPKNSTIDNDFEDTIKYWKQITDKNDAKLAAMISSDYAKTGEHSMLLDGTPAETAVEYLLSVEDNQTYFLSLYTLAQTSGGTVSITTLDDINYEQAVVQEYAPSADWENLFVSFNSVSNKVMRIKITQNAGGKAYIDAIKCSTDSGSIVIPDSKITATDSKLWALKEGGTNLIANGDFEADAPAGTSWNQDTFLTGGVTVDTASAYQGSKGLSVEIINNTKTSERIMWIDVEKNTDYVFSTYVRGEYLSDKNRADLTFGLVEQLTKGYLTDGTDICTLAPSCWDNQWHIIGYEFNSGNQEKIGIKLSAKNAVAHFDNMLICKASDAKVVSLVEPKGKLTLEVTENITENNSCADADNLVKDYNFESTDHSFWTDVKGYGDFANIIKSHDLAGNVMMLENDGIATWQKYIKWIEVTPNTEYTLSLLLRSDEDGENSFGIIDENYNVLIDVEQGDAEGEWKNICFSFKSNDNKVIGLYFSDGAGKAAITDIRLFEKSKGFKAEIPNYALPIDKTSPATGDNVSVLVMVFALSLAFASVCVFVRKKRHHN